LTRDGFSIYDGQRFTNYQRLDNKNIGIIDDGILLADSSVLLFTFDSRVIRVKNKSISIDTALSNKISETSIIHPFEKDQIIISNYGLYLFRNGHIQQLNQEKNSVSIKNIENSVVVSNAFIVYNKIQGLVNKLYLYDIKRQSLLDSIVLNGKCYCIKANAGGTILISWKMQLCK
jgi:hypothetical protein